MTREEYLSALRETYRVVHVLADRNGCRTLHLRHREKGRDMVLHSLPQPVVAYEMLCGISCAALPVIYDVIELEDGQIVLEEYIDGISVERMLECSPYTYHEAKKLVASVCDALSVLHANGLVHRDVKPSNVMLEQGGRVVLVDFNIARQVSGRKTRDTVVMGTVGYVSPEQLGVAQSDARTDIYAVGVLLNVLLTGKHPSECLAKGRAGRIVRKCTAVSPSDRYQTVEKLKQAL